MIAVALAVIFYVWVTSPPILATVPPPGAQAVPGVPTGPPAGPGPVNVRAVTAEVAPATVDLTVRLRYGTDESEGTGIVLTSSGIVLTAEHVVFQGVDITGQIADRGPTYHAALIGVDAADDIALLQLEHASGLRTATLGDPSTAAVGDQVVFVGYTGVAGPDVVRGKIASLHESVNEGPEGDRAEEVVNDQIETDAKVIDGQSGGPLVDASGRVIGMTATRWVSDAGDFGAATSIDRALSIARQIAAGQPGPDIVIGLPAGLGVETETISTDRFRGALVLSVHSGTPAQSAGIGLGDVITGIDRATIGSAPELAQVLTRYHRGDQVSVRWADTDGHRHGARITLTTGSVP